MTQPPQLERILEIDRQIRAGQFPNAERLAAQMQLSKRVLFHDKRFMVERLGAPIAFDRTRGGWCYTDPAWTLPATFATEGELLAFFLSLELTRRYAGGAYEAPLRAAVAKLAAGLGGHVQVSLEALSAAYTASGLVNHLAAPDPPPAAEMGGPDRLVALQHAIRERQVLRLQAAAANKVHTVQPCLLYHLHGHWHLFAHDLQACEMLNLQVDQIERWQILDEAVPDLVR